MQIFLNGFISGLGIALLAVAFQSVYLPTRIFFIGLAGIYSFTPFIAHTILAYGGGWHLAVGVSVFVSVLLCILSEWVNHARLARRQASDGTHLITSLGIYIVLVQIIALIWGNAPQALRVGLDSVTQFNEIVITRAQWITLVVALLLLGGYGVFLMKTDLGLRLRALADNPVQFALLGYNVDYYRLFAFCLSGVFAASAALVTSYDIGFDPYIGLPSVLLAVVAVIIGGKTSFIGPVLGALLLGVLRAQVVWHFSSRWQDALTFALLALIILIRPQGLLGRKTRLEAQL
jgi:branched-chain amino acid transport system permease protein